MNDAATRNSLSEAMIDALHGAIAMADARVIVVAANGPAFSSGHNLKEITAHRADADGGAAYFKRLFDKCAALMLAVTESPCPVIAEIDGIVSFGERKRGKSTILLTPADGGEEVEHLVPLGRHIRVRRDDVVKAGDPLVDGPLVPHDILRISGEEKVENYLLEEIQKVYRSQGVSINDKHIEIILQRMLRKVRIDDLGDADFKRLLGVTRSTLLEMAVVVKKKDCSKS